MTWKDEIKKKKDFEEYYGIVSIILKQLGRHQLEITKLFGALDQIIREQQDFEIMKDLEEVLGHRVKANQKMLDIVRKMKERTDMDASPKTNPKDFDEDEWRRSMR
tara:strand:+ start:380 stop:697 length:318 start_codon:yes stop_codon:yes gene_type:complete